MKGDSLFVLEHDDCVLQQGYNRQSRSGIAERKVMLFFVIYIPFSDAGVVEHVLVVAKVEDLVQRRTGDDFRSQQSQW